MLLTVITLVSVLKLSRSGPITPEETENLSPRQVNTKYGTLRGTYVTFTPSQQSLSSQINSINLPAIEAYLGVPYATPPIGSLRFMPPVTPTHWRGTRLANKLSPVCPQRIPLSKLIMTNSTESLKRMPLQRFEYMRKLIPLLKNQSEDCLYLNIFTPVVGGIHSTSPSVSELSSKKLKVPVVVFIHGESYDWNSGNVYDGSILSSFGQVIIVTLNYRLGILGFLPVLVDGTVRGNYGLMDQVAALHWIQENIAEFGGQPNNVTIIGHGYGAACAHLLMISPMAKGLFSRVILMSGSALSPWAIARDADLYAKNIAQELNCPIHDNALLVECLRQKRIDELFSVDYQVPDHLTAFGPIIDGIVVPSEPRYLMQAETQNRGFRLSHHSDLLIGVTRVEAPPVFNSHEERHGIDVIRRDRILRTLVRNLFDFHQQAILLTLINEYTDWTRPVEHPINLLDSLLDIMSDALVVGPAIETSDLHSKNPLPTKPYQHRQSSTRAQSRGKTFFYVFVHQVIYDFLSKPGISQKVAHYLLHLPIGLLVKSEEGSKFHQRLGCSHGEELAYMFGAPLSQHLLGKSMAHFATNYSRAEVSLAEGVMTYWINFAKYGDPNIWPFELDSNGDRTKGRFESVVWPQYDQTQRKYLMLGLKPKVRDHYHSHRLSFWLNLIPRLHHPGEEQVYLRHHLLSDHDNMASYDGIVRQIAFKFFAPIPNKSVTVIPVTNISKNRKKYFITTSSIELNVNDDADFEQSVTTESIISFYDNQTTTELIPFNDEINSNNKSQSPAITMSANYSTALLVTIAIGCSLLILNMLIFAGVYYQLDKNSSAKEKTKSKKNRSPSHDQHHSHYHYHDTCCQSQEMIVLATPQKRTLSEKRALSQKLTNNSHNHVEIVNTSILDNQLENSLKNRILRCNDSLRCSDSLRCNDSLDSNQKLFSCDHSHGSPVPSSLSTSDTTTTTIIHVPLSYHHDNDHFAQEIRV